MDASIELRLNHLYEGGMHTEYCPYFKKEMEPWQELNDTEFDCYNDVFLNYSLFSTNSYYRDKYMMMGKKQRFVHSDVGPECRSSLEELGYNKSKDEDSLSELLLLGGMPYSDEETSENFQDQAMLQGTMMMDEQEELRLIAELINQDATTTEYYNDYHTISSQNIYRSMESTKRTKSKFCPSLGKDLLANSKCNTRSVINNANSTIKEVISRTNAVEPANVMKSHSKRSIRKANDTCLISTKTSPNDINSAADFDQKIFLGGLPLGMNEKALREELAAQGYKVLKRPKILRAFAPEVMMRSVDEAKELVEKGFIMINGFEVEVRSFNSYNKQSKVRKIPNVGKRSVFLGGLAIGTTVKDIQDVMMKLGLRIVNYPVIKLGFSRQLIFETISQAQKLIKMKKVLINGKHVNVRPFSHQQSRKRMY